VALAAFARQHRGAGAGVNNLGYSYHYASDYRQARATYREGLSVLAQMSYQRAESYLLAGLPILSAIVGHLTRRPGCIIRRLS